MKAAPATRPSVDVTAPGRLALLLILPALLLAAWGPSTHAQSRDPKGGLQAVQRSIEEQRAAREAARREAETVAEEVNTLRGRLVNTARAVKDLESEALAVERRIREIEAAGRDGAQRLAAQQAASANIVSAMVRLARFPPEAVIVQPWPPGDVVRAAIAVRAAVPLVSASARGLRTELADMARIRAEIRERKTALNVKLVRLEKERKELDGLLGKRRSLQQSLAMKEKRIDNRVEELSLRAKDLQDLMERIERERREQAVRDAEARAKAEVEARARSEAETVRRLEDERRRARDVHSIVKAKGNLAFPVAGRVIGLYGQPTASGLARKGVEIETRAEAQVLAPFEGEVAFAGPFRGYGRILIIDHGEGYHSLLAGLDQIDGVPGHRVMAGEPIGRMGRLGAGLPVLYLEFRRDGQPINPLPWLARTGHGVNG